MSLKRLASFSRVVSQGKGSLKTLSNNKLSLYRMTDPSNRINRLVSLVYTNSSLWTSPFGNAQGITLVDYLIAGGGGGGGSSYGGGGGGGGFLSGTISVSSNTTYTIAVGAGGSQNPAPTSGSNGSNSGRFNTSSGTSLVSWALGGGGGGASGGQQKWNPRGSLGSNGGSGIVIIKWS